MQADDVLHVLNFTKWKHESTESVISSLRSYDLLKNLNKFPQDKLKIMVFSKDNKQTNKKCCLCRKKKVEQNGAFGTAFERPVFIAKVDASHRVVEKFGEGNVRVNDICYAQGRKESYLENPCIKGCIRGWLVSKAAGTEKCLLQSSF